MNETILTIGMPTCNDYTGALLTLVALKEYQSFDDGDIELLIIDNTPDEKYRNVLKEQLKGFSDEKIRYIEFPAKRGPAEAKNQVFENATGEYVMCIDSHVMLNNGSVARLKEFLKNLPEDKKDDFFTGPLKGNEGNYSTHFQDIWRGEMWGIWG
jgi:glycosyltransferase involved in cell wall biosynthesis